MLCVRIALLLLALSGAYACIVVLWTAFSHLRFALYFRAESLRPPALGGLGWLRFYGRTVRGAFLLLWWWFRAAFADGLRSPATAGRNRAVLCVHGIFMNGTCMWGIRRFLEASARPTRAISMGLPFPSPERYAHALRRAMREMQSQYPDEGFDLVAHSLGGVILRQVLRDHPELAGSLRHIVTLGSPHQGTAVLRWFRSGPIYRMIHLGSPYLQELGDLARLAPAARVTTLATLQDLVVYPSPVAHLEGAHQVTLRGVSHLGLLTEPSVHTLIVDELEAPLRPPDLL